LNDLQKGYWSHPQTVWDVLVYIYYNHNKEFIEFSATKSTLYKLAISIRQTGPVFFNQQLDKVFEDIFVSPSVTHKYYNPPGAL
jgi:hypothetical protein